MPTQFDGVEQPKPEGQEAYTFKREDGRWYACLSAAHNRGWNKEELELREGAEKLLNVLSNGSKRVRLRLCLQPFDGADRLELIEHCVAPKGGGIYLLHSDNERCNALYWICDLALFVFGDIPDCIYFNALPVRNGDAAKEKTTAVYRPQFNPNKGRLQLKQ